MSLMPGMDYSEIPSPHSAHKPPKVYRRVEEDGSIKDVRKLMNDLVQEDLVQKKLRIYRLDTLVLRETRLVSQLGQAAIDKYLEALSLLGGDSWHQPLTVPVRDITTEIRKGVNGRRVVVHVEYPEELVRERQRALAITTRMTGLELPDFNFRRDITLGKLNPDFDSLALQNRLDQVTPSEITLLPTITLDNNECS